MSASFGSRRERIDRIRARAWALQVLYAWEAAGGTERLRDVLVETTAHRRISPRRLPYVREVLKTLDAHRDEVDDRLGGALDNWRMERLAAVDRALLRLAATEMLYLEEVPPRVSIQEAVRLAEQYGGPESPRFVNGVLDALYRGFRKPDPPEASRVVTSAPAREPSSLLRILVVNWQDLANPQSGGAEIHLHESFGRLADRGHRVHLLCSGFSGAPARADADGMTIHRVGSRYTFPLHAHRYFRESLSHIPFDVVVEDLNKVPLFTPRWTDAPVVPLVHHLFGWTAFREANPLVAAATVLLEWPVPAFFRHHPVVAVSESTREDLVARGFRREQITVIPNGVDLSAYHPPGVPVDHDGGAGQPFDLAGWDPLAGRYPEPSLLYLGRLKRYKRVELILQALAVLRDRGVAARLRVGGRGDHAAALRREAERLDLMDRVEFLGFVPEEIKLELLRRSWIHVLTSPKEGWGIANLEAAACGTPTVASDAPGLRDSVRDGRTGLLVPHGDVPALADALQTLLDNPERRARLSRGAAAFAGEFSWDATARRLESILIRAAAGRGGRVARFPRDP